MLEGKRAGRLGVISRHAFSVDVGGPLLDPGRGGLVMIEIAGFDQITDLLPRFGDCRFPWIIRSSGFGYRQLHWKPSLGLVQARMLSANPGLHMVRHDSIALRAAIAPRGIPGRDAIGLAIDRGHAVAECREIRKGFALYAEQMEPDGLRKNPIEMVDDGYQPFRAMDCTSAHGPDSNEPGSVDRPR